MEFLVLGCGEAFDERLPNTSYLLRAPGLKALIDCGYSVPPRVFQSTSFDEVDLIYITHAHADHYFGLPAVLGRWWEDGRTKPLTVASQQSVIDQIRDVLEYGYRTLAARFQYPIEYRAAEAGQTIESHGARFDFAPTRHSVTNYAVRIGIEGKAICVSGDGMFTKESAALFEGADLLCHEAFSFDPSPVHADIEALLKMAAERQVARLALVHIQRNVRKDRDRIARAMESAGLPAGVPEPGESFVL
jgi:ribonuclease BN (tRNA processing enzyme)